MRVIAEQRRGLRADACAGNHVSRERPARCRIDDLNRLSERVAALREIARALERSGHQARLRRRVVIVAVQKREKHVRPVRRHEVPEAQRPAEQAVHVEVVVLRLGHGLAGEVERPRVERGVAFDDRELVAEQRSSAPPVVAESRALGERG